MSLKRIIPKIIVSDYDNSYDSEFVSILTKEYRFFRTIGNPLQQIKILESNHVDELLIILKSKADISGTFLKLIEEICANTSTAITVGGGIKQATDVDSLFSLGIDRIILGRFRKNKALTSHIVSKHGSQALIYSLDIDSQANKVPFKESILNEINHLLQSGFGEISINDISLDGSQKGLNLEALRLVLEHTRVPVTIGCGIGSIKDVENTLSLGASGVTLSTFLAQKDQSPRQISAHLNALNITTRKY
jgi:imidazole glycerol phosphate synthase subunit HisF